MLGVQQMQYKVEESKILYMDHGAVERIWVISVISQQTSQRYFWKSVENLGNSRVYIES